MNRAEVFEGTGPTPGSYIRVKMGADQDGASRRRGVPGLRGRRLPRLADRRRLRCASSPATTSRTSASTATTSWSTSRRPRPTARPAPQRRLRRRDGDRRDLREAEDRPARVPPQERRQGGTAAVRRPGYPRIGMIETCQAAKNHPHYQAAARAAARTAGRGVAVGFWFNIGLKSSATASVNADGTVSLVEGSTDIGGTRLDRHAARPRRSASRRGRAAQVVDTDSVGYTDVTGGSRVDLRHRLGGLRGGAGHPAPDVARSGRQDLGGARRTRSPTRTARPSKTDEGKRLTFKELAAKLQTPAARSSAGRASTRRAGGAFAATSSTSRSTPRPARSTILRYTAVQDVGTAIHPSYVEGQIQGGVVQGIGWALNEEYFYDDRADGERQLPRLPHADDARPADDRHGDRRGAEPRPPLRRARRRRCPSCPPGGRRRRHRPRHRGAPGAPPHVPYKEAAGKI